MRTYADIKATLQRELPYLHEHYHVETLGVFGSYVRGEQTEESDLDVLVTYTKTPGLFDFVALKHHLEDLLGLKVDLGTRNAIKPHARPRILSEVELV